MSLEFIAQTVNGYEYRDVYENFPDNTCDFITSEVRTKECGWVNHTHICTTACNSSCRCAQNFFDEVDIDY